MSWEVWRQDDNGNRVRMSAHDDRVEALARIAGLESGYAHKQLYWVAGPPGPVCRTDRDLYQRLSGAGARMNAEGRGLAEFLRAWWLVARPYSGESRLDVDTVAAMVLAAVTVEPPPPQPSWRTAEHRPGEGFAGWEAVILSQIADLADFADQGPLDKYAYFGVAAPRPDGARRATGSYWYNFDPETYLECGMAGAVGGWDEADGVRTPVPGPVVQLRPEPEPGEHPLGGLTWDELTELAICGQEYE